MIKRILIIPVLVFSCSLLLMAQNSDMEFNPKTVINRVFDPITDFPVISIAETELENNELVLGTVINDEARAYPINMLTGPRREILNDRLGNQAIAATW
ncbi:MAG TPA: DUF3179 domain-containing protein [Verrucomicrobiales bacterium]|nr:DUF3179 domain-containing protein [Verrucomicrobiales bacterium]HIL70225.1 DUF3179 domain-containing protein [Verrucomicrobiota bacterium]